MNHSEPLHFGETQAGGPGVMPLSFFYVQYTAAKNAWLAAHPKASLAQIERASRVIARRIGL